MSRLWNISETAEYLSVSTKFVRRHARELGGFRVGSHLRFRPTAIESYLERNRLDGRARRRLHE